MNIEEVREMCLSIHPGVEECSPFAEIGHPDLAYRIAGKIFAYLCMPEAPSCLHNGTANLIVLKCNPERAIELRELHAGVIEPAWHWNKKYWNQCHYDLLSPDCMLGLIRHSFDEVVAKLPKKQRQIITPE